MNRLKRIAAIHDLSGAGKCSLTVALPVISAAGVECACIPTAILSTHTGEFTGYAFRDLTDMLMPVAEHWLSSGIELDGIYSGYLATPEQAVILGKIIDLLGADGTKIIIDPVMADNGVFYASLDQSMTAAFRRLCARADLLTPNITEAALLAGLPFEAPPHSGAYVKKLMNALFALGAKAAVITGILPDEKTVANAVAKPGMEPVYETRPLVGGAFYGTGDIFASAMAALLVKGADEREALKISTRLVDSAVKNTAARGTPRRFGADFESALPAFIAAASRIGGPSE